MAQRLSDKSVKQYEDQLLELRSRVRGEVNDIVDHVPNVVSKPGEPSHVPTHIADQDAEGFDTELALLHNEEELLAAVEEALRRIEAGTYGRCTSCGADIGRQRLDALPYTPLCIRCAEQQSD